MLGRLHLIGLFLAATGSWAFAAEGETQTGWLGVHLGKIGSALTNQLNLEEQEGLVILKVMEDSPAAKGGLQEHDVVTGFNGQPIEDLGAFVNAVGDTEPGQIVKLDLIRNGKALSLDVELGARPASGDMEWHWIQNIDGLGAIRGIKMFGGGSGEDGLHLKLKEIIGDVDAENTNVNVECKDGKCVATVERNGQIETIEFDCDFGEGQKRCKKIFIHKLPGDIDIDIDIPDLDGLLKLELPDLEGIVDLDLGDIPRGIMRAHKIMIGQPQTSFKVNTNGSIEVTTRKGDNELTLSFENAEALQAQKPELYEKYQDLISDSE